jgi:hypothetical protein
VSPWSFLDPADTPTTLYPYQITSLNGGALSALPVGYPASTGWFNGTCGSGSPNGIAQALRGVRVTFTNAVITATETDNTNNNDAFGVSLAGYTTVNDGSGPFYINNAVVSLNLVSGLCGHTAGTVLKSLTACFGGRPLGSPCCSTALKPRFLSPGYPDRDAARLLRRLHRPAVRNL